MREDGAGGIGPVAKIWRHGVVHGGGERPAMVGGVQK